MDNSEQEIDEKIKKAVAEALQDADQRAKKIADEAVEQAANALAAELAKKYREQGERKLWKGYWNLGAGVFCALLGLAIYNSSSTHPAFLIVLGVILMGVGADAHKRGKALIALADQHEKPGTETEA